MMTTSLLLPGLVFCLCVAVAWSQDVRGLAVETFANAALFGAPSAVHVISSLDSVTIGPLEGSAQIIGSLSVTEASLLAFQCSFAGGQIVFVWVQDHMVCHTTPPFASTKGAVDGTPQNPLRIKDANMELTIRIHVYSASLDGSGMITSDPNAIITVQWAIIDVPQPVGADVVFRTIPKAKLTPTLPPLEVARSKLQESLKEGWSLWTRNLLAVARLPHSVSITTAICHLSNSSCLNSTYIEDTAAIVRVGPFAFDQSYWQFFVSFQGLNISISATGGKSALRVLIDPLNCDSSHAATAANCSDFAVVVFPRFLWNRPGSASTDDGGRITLLPMAFNSTRIRPTRAPTLAASLPSAIKQFGHAAFVLEGGAVGLYEGEGPALTLEAVVEEVEAARASELKRYAAYGGLAEVKEAVQAAITWNHRYVPAELGPVLPVSRAWNFVPGSLSEDWEYVLFDWDNLFASYMAALDPRGKAIAYSNLIQIVRARTASGFVPNFAAGSTKSVDRTEPPVGAKVVLELYKRFKDKWIVELLFDDLTAWSDWFFSSRAWGPLGLISPGSDYIDGQELPAHGMQGARFETGLDDSPMYDVDVFNDSVWRLGSFREGQMQLYDVGFASLCVQEAEALASLALVLGRRKVSRAMAARAEEQRRLISTHLWDEASGVFVNKFWNGSFYRRVSPTSFYPLMAGAATDDQAESMVQKWLLSPLHFCIAPNGDFAGNADDCYWGLPSIQRSDPAFPKLGYWRGYVWGPMAQLTYWGLERYDHVEVVRGGRKALCAQMTALMLSQWRSRRHVCENYSPHRTADDHGGDCSGTKFYHWGALMGAITMVEHGFWAPAPHDPVQTHPQQLPSSGTPQRLADVPVLV